MENIKKFIKKEQKDPNSNIDKNVLKLFDKLSSLDDDTLKEYYIWLGEQLDKNPVYQVNKKYLENYQNLKWLNGLVVQ